MTKPIEDAANALAIRTALGVPTNAELAAVSGVANAAYVKPADGIPHNDLHTGIRDQLDLADTALQPGELPVNTTVTAAQISDAGAAGRTLLQKATLPEIQSLVSGDRASINSRARPLTVDGYRLVNTTADTPTVTITAAAPNYASSIIPPIEPTVAIYNTVLTWDGSQNLANIAGNMVGIGIVIPGLRLTIRWRCGTANVERFLIFVDGKPTTALPFAAGIATASGTRYSMDLTWTTARKRLVEVYMVGANALTKLEVPFGDPIAAGPSKEKLILTQDSFGAGSAMVSSQIYLPQWQLTHLLNADVYANSYGGSGWVTPGPQSMQFAHATRVAYAASTGAKRNMFVGSVNDTTATGLAAAVTASLATYSTAIAGHECIVIGPQATSATVTISTLRQQLNAAVKSGALAAPACKAFYDWCGHADGMPAAFSASTIYQFGDLVTHKGSVWQHVNTVASTYPTGLYAPGAIGAGTTTYNNWRLVTWDVFGTGNAGAVAGDGSRDTLLGSDLVHWTDAGAQAYSYRMASVAADVFA